MLMLQSFRNNYGLTVNDTANLLQCPRAQISMSEIEKRSLPELSKKILRHLEKAIEQYVPKSGITTSKSTSVTFFLNKKIKKHKAALEKLTLEKESIEQKIAAALQQQNLLAALKNRLNFGFQSQ
jgi:cell division protein FtsB